MKQRETFFFVCVCVCVCVCESFFLFIGLILQNEEPKLYLREEYWFGYISTEGIFTLKIAGLFQPCLCQIWTTFKPTVGFKNYTHTQNKKIDQRFVQMWPKHGLSGIFTVFGNDNGNKID